MLVIGHFADKRVQEQGNWQEPFAKSMTGIYFSEFLQSVGLSFNDMKFVNGLQCLTKTPNTTPQLTDLERCMETYLFGTIEEFNPNLIITWGSPVFYIFNQLIGNFPERITKQKGSVSRYNGATVYSMYHPCYAIRFQPERDKLKQHFAQIYQEL
ncbi:MAG: Type-4 uracil-DNA glycosylase [Candidatus Woesearchaeota archaeon]|nr:Type-4 uracil-DNA glycosylase [Candidatus Woesearchaeota archaeon]